jgi:predicted HTH domain antitoxin
LGRSLGKKQSAKKAGQYRTNILFTLHHAGELSIGAASELAGMDRDEFLDFCKREGITLRTQTPEELEADLKKYGKGK